MVSNGSIRVMVRGLGLVLRLVCWEYICYIYIRQMVLVCRHTEYNSHRNRQSMYTSNYVNRYKTVYTSVPWLHLFSISVSSYVFIRLHSYLHFVLLLQESPFLFIYTTTLFVNKHRIQITEHHRMTAVICAYVSM